MARERIDAWLLYDFRCSNPAFVRLIGGRRHLTRRVALLVPSKPSGGGDVGAVGGAVLICSRIDQTHLKDLAVRTRTYVTWGEFQAVLREELVAAGCARVAMEYAPGGALPAASVVDAGTIELVRSMGVEVCSSADVVQASVARWGDDALAAHRVASAQVAEIKDEAFGFIGAKLRAGESVHELAVAEFIRGRFREAGLEWPDGPIVAANAHAGDPHFEPTPDRSVAIVRGDWVLIDLWARRPGEANIFSDITWVGCCGEPTARQREVFEVVRGARDGALRLARERWSRGHGVQGWELDDAARGVIERAGFRDAIRHRTGHSLSSGTMVHGLGMNLDNLETRDTRRMLVGTGFTIEPGVYLEDFGVRLEINVYVDAAEGPVVTSCVQDEIVRIV